MKTGRLLREVIFRPDLSLQVRNLIIYWHCFQVSFARAQLVKKRQNLNQKGPSVTFRINLRDIEDITRWREDMNFMFEWQEKYLTSERIERVGYCSCHENIKFISSS